MQASLHADRQHDKKVILEALSKEVLGTHKGLKGPELDLWIGDHFDSTWEYYDAAHQGSLAPDRMPSFMRYLANDRKLAIFAQTDV